MTAKTDSTGEGSVKTVLELREQRLNLRSIILDVYHELNFDGIKDEDNYVIDSRYKLKNICEQMGVPFNEFKGENDRYDIPLFTAELFKTFLRASSKKGSTVSNLKIGAFEKIGYNEIIDIIKSYTASLREKYSGVEGIEEDVQRHENYLMHRAEYIKARGELKDKISSVLDEYFENTVSKLLQEESYISIIMPSLNYKELEKIAKRAQTDETVQLPSSEGPDWIVYNGNERIALLNKLLKNIKGAFATWEEFLNFYFEARDVENNVEKYSLEELIKMAEGDYYSSLETRFEERQRAKDFDFEKMDQIMRELEAKYANKKY